MEMYTNENVGLEEAGSSGISNEEAPDDPASAFC